MAVNDLVIAVRDREKSQLTLRPVAESCRRNVMRIKLLLIALGAVFLLGGCLDSDKDTDLQDDINTAGFFARFDPSNSVIPFPNNLLFSGTTDFTLNIPFDPADADAAVKTALNALDGFSTIAPITASFSSAVDSATLVAGSTVRLFEVVLNTRPDGVVAAIVRELGATEYLVSLSSIDTSMTTVVISPLSPLAPKTSYLVVLTRGIKSTGGLSAGAELPYAMTKSRTALVDGSGVSQFSALSDAQAVALEPVRLQTNFAEFLVSAAPNLDPSDIVLSWTFTTQSISDVLITVRSAVQNAAPPVSVLADSMADSPLGAADIYVGTIDLTYYLTAASGVNDATPLSTFWTGAGGSNLTWINPVPVATSTETVPLMVSIPKTPAKPGGGWPVVIYQHGITGSRATLLAVADALAGAGFASVAIDMPLHGLTGNETDGTQAFYIPGGERTFDLDLVDNTTNAPGPDGITDTSGTHFINLTSLLTSRDNIRQAEADLLSLTRALSMMDYDGGGSDFDTANIRFLGQSLGGIAGATFLALESTVGAATLAMPGGGIAKLLDGSATFGPIIAAGLAANGIDKGTSDYEAFLASAQMVIDAGDPINYTADIGANRGIHLVEIIGGNNSLPDQVIPNNVLNVAGTVPSPTAGTDPLATLMSLTKTSSSTTGTNLQTWVRFTAGHHGSLLTPNDASGNSDATSAAVTTEIQTQMAGFLATNGATLTITDSSVVE